MPVPNGPAQRPPAAINPTLTGATLSGVQDAPLTELPLTTEKIVDWVPDPGPRVLGTATAPSITAQASILRSDGSVFPGTLPPYVAGDIPFSDDPAVLKAATSVILKPNP